VVESQTARKIEAAIKSFHLARHNIQRAQVFVGERLGDRDAEKKTSPVEGTESRGDKEMRT
jgi:hypothetical protein